MIPVRDLSELQRALRERAEVLDISREALDEIAGITKGYAAKLLSEPPVKFLGVGSMFPMLGALGYDLVLIEGDQRFQKRAARRKPGGPRGTKWRSPRYLAVAADYGRRGARKALSQMTPEEISAQRSKASKARWRKYRKAMRELRKRPDLMREVELR